EAWCCASTDVRTTPFTIPRAMATGRSSCQSPIRMANGDLHALGAGQAFQRQQIELYAAHVQYLRDAAGCDDRVAVPSKLSAIGDGSTRLAEVAVREAAEQLATCDRLETVSLASKQ